LVGLNRAAQQAGMGDVKDQPCLFHRGPSRAGFAYALVGQFDIVPTRKQIELIPGALAVTKKDKGASHGVDGRRRGDFSGI
jgi:hypothetical protein